MEYNSKKLLLIDSLGAVLSAFLLGVVLVRFESSFGMPVKVLNLLSWLACAFAVYSFLSFLLIKKRWRTALRVIAVTNLGYCCLTIALGLVYREELTALGCIYFAAEVVVVAALAGIELNAASMGSNSGESFAL